MSLRLDLALPPLPTRLSALEWLRLLRPGDGLILLGLMALCVYLFSLVTTGGPVDRAVIRRDGKVVAEVMLAVHKRIEVQGPLGTSIVEIEPGRARIASDPGLKQLCVQQGWLERANATALCLPNRISLQVLSKHHRHDSIGY